MTELDQLLYDLAEIFWKMKITQKTVLSKYNRFFKIIFGFLFVVGNRPFQGFRRHLGGGAVAAKITANVWGFKILITIVLALIYTLCFEHTVSLSIPIKRHDFCQTPLYNSGVTRFES